MRRLSAVLGQFANGELAWWCPGCQRAHHVNLREGSEHPSWTWDGDVERPTLSPSVRHFYDRYVRDTDGKVVTDTAGKPVRGEQVTTCHYFITAGQIRYCGDCQHALNGQAVPLPPLPGDDEYGWPP